MQETRIPEPERFRSQAYAEVLDNAGASSSCNISPEAMHTMHASAACHYPLEACGLLIGSLSNGSWLIDQALEVANLNTERAADRFILDPQGYQKADRELSGTGREIIGIYHSHPDCPAIPSPTDLSSAWDGFAYIIVSACEGKAADTRCWALNDSGKRFSAIHMTVKEFNGATD